MRMRDLYDKYNLMPQLRVHQLRVGAIVRLMTKDKLAVLTALVHDMGNLAKFDNLDPYWTSEQEVFRARYGRDAHEATFNILKEAGLDYLVTTVTEEGKLYQNIMNADFTEYSDAAVYTLYADCRVAINGVVTLEERIVDLETRYRAKRNDRLWAPKLEAYIQGKVAVELTTITEEDVAPLFDELLTYTL